MLPAHPRTRGEHPPTVSGRERNLGSSPHTRGTRRACRPSSAHRRLIPAHAGNTRERPAGSGGAPAHPRTRGEHDEPVLGLDGDAGSSPHTRGTRAERGAPGWPRRLIPAHAGNTGIRRKSGSRGAAHPRTRGEHGFSVARSAAGVGSSPHTRGTLIQGQKLSDCTRLIPAHAGNTAPTRAAPEAAPAHPRTRGEHARGSSTGAAPAGSSPHTRGTLSDATPPPADTRLIPAHAGNTQTATIAEGNKAAHPRTRGEHRSAPCPAAATSGSSPHTRGTQAARVEAADRLRLIPAHAGNTGSRGACGSRRPAHPRTRGEHARGGGGQMVAPGSSPHTRGTRALLAAHEPVVRLIPAHAGNTRASE